MNGLISKLYFFFVNVLSSFFSFLLRVLLTIKSTPSSITMAIFLIFALVWLSDPTIFFYKLLSKHCYFLILLTLFFMTMNFLNYFQFSSKNNSFLQRFWKRALVLFWSIELFTFGIFAYLALFSSELSRFYISQANHSEITSRPSWFWSMFSFSLIAALLSLSLLLMLNRMTMSSLLINSLVIFFVALLWCLFIFEFSKFFLSLNFFGKKSMEMSQLTTSLEAGSKKLKGSISSLKKILNQEDLNELQDSAFSQNISIKNKLKVGSAKLETRVFFSILIVILKFWHVFFVVFFISTFIKNNCRFFDLSSNASIASMVVNLNFLAFFNFIGYIFVAKKFFKPLFIPSYSLWSETTSFGYMAINSELISMLFICLNP